jgi:hypothetical protein
VGVVILIVVDAGRLGRAAGKPHVDPQGNLVKALVTSYVKIMSEREVIGVEAIVDNIMDTMDDVYIHNSC